MSTRKEVHMVTRSLAMQLRVLRAERQLSLREASKQTGVDKVALSRYERGLAHPQDRTLGKIAEGYGVPVEELLGLEEPLPLGDAPAGGERRLARVLEPARKALLQEGEGERPQSYILAPAAIEVAERFLAEFAADEWGEGFAQLALRCVRAEEEVRTLREALRESTQDIVRLLKAEEEDAEAGRLETLKQLGRRVWAQYREVAGRPGQALSNDEVERLVELGRTLDAIHSRMRSILDDLEHGRIEEAKSKVRELVAA